MMAGFRATACIELLKVLYYRLLLLEVLRMLRNGKLIEVLLEALVQVLIGVCGSFVRRLLLVPVMVSGVRLVVAAGTVCRRGGAKVRRLLVCVGLLLRLLLLLLRRKWLVGGLRCHAAAVRGDR